MMLRSPLHHRRVLQVALHLLPRLLLRGRTRRPSKTAGGAPEIQRSRAWTRPHAARPCRSSSRMFQRPRPRIRQSRWCVHGLTSMSSGSATTPPSSHSHLSQWRPSAPCSSCNPRDVFLGVGSWDAHLPYDAEADGIQRRDGDMHCRCAAKLGLSVLDADNAQRFGGHSLRVTGARWLAGLGLPLVSIQLLARWDGDVFRRYIAEAPLRRLSEDHLRAAGDHHMRG